MGPQDLLIFPCSAAKEGSPLIRPIPSARIMDFLGRKAAHDLESARESVFRDKRTDDIWIEARSHPMPGLTLYSGNQYLVPHFKDRVIDAIGSGVHCLIISGGYGLIRAEEPIHKYGAEITQTRKYWKDVISEVLADYIRRNEIGRVFIGSSSSYVGILKRKGWSGNAQVYWCIPKLPKGEGGAQVKVPRLTGDRVVELIDSRFEPGRQWTKKWPE
jgi:hypothetical protein